MGFPTRREHPSETDDRAMKKVFLISVAVLAILLLALAGWVSKPFRRSAPAYA